MASYTTTAEILRRIFTHLNKAIPTSNNGTTLFAAWSTVLGGEGRTEFNVVSSIADVLSVLDKLDSQVNASNDLDDFLKKSALLTVSSFRPLFGFQNMNTHAFNFRPICDPSIVGTLGIIGLSLKDEFSEPKMSTDDSKLVISILNEVKELINNNDIPVDLRVSLEKHISTMIWWLGRPEIVSLQDIIERTGSTLVVAQQIEERGDTPDKKGLGRSIKEKVAKASRVVFDSMGFMVRNADNFEKLEGVYQKLISGPTSS